MSDDDKNRGLYDKYHVRRLNDPTFKHDYCDFFVLDLTHDKYAWPALLAYARFCRKEYPELDRDLRRKILDSEEGRKYMDADLAMRTALNETAIDAIMSKKRMMSDVLVSLNDLAPGALTGVRVALEEAYLCGQEDSRK